MTCIIGHVDKLNNKVYIAGDSAATYGATVTIRKDPKVFKNGDFVIGCTTSFRMAQLLQFSFIPPPIRDKEIFEYMCTDFINEIRNCFNKGGFMQKGSDGDEIGGCFLVGYKDRLFEIDSDYQVAENLDGIATAGCGYDVALGALYGNESEDILYKINKTLDIVVFLCNGVRPPFIIEST